MHDICWCWIKERFQRQLLPAKREKNVWDFIWSVRLDNKSGSEKEKMYKITISLQSYETLLTESEDQIWLQNVSIRPPASWPQMNVSAACGIKVGDLRGVDMVMWHLQLQCSHINYHNSEMKFFKLSVFESSDKVTSILYNCGKMLCVTLKGKDKCHREHFSSSGPPVRSTRTRTTVALHVIWQGT